MSLLPSLKSQLRVLEYTTSKLKMCAICLHTLMLNHSTKNSNWPSSNETLGNTSRISSDITRVHPTLHRHRKHTQTFHCTTSRRFSQIRMKSSLLLESHQVLLRLDFNHISCHTPHSCLCSPVIQRVRSSRIALLDK